MNHPEPVRQHPGLGCASTVTNVLVSFLESNESFANQSYRIPLVGFDWLPREGESKVSGPTLCYNRVP